MKQPKLLDDGGYDHFTQTAAIFAGGVMALIVPVKEADEEAVLRAFPNPDHFVNDRHSLAEMRQYYLALARHCVRLLEGK